MNNALDILNIEVKANDTLLRISTDITNQMAESVIKHGPVTADPVRACANLAEELGEVAEQALKLTSRDEREHISDSGRVELRQMRHELCQLAAYAILCINKIDEGGFNRARPST